MDQEHEDYGDAAPPRRRVAEFLFVLLVITGVLLVAFAGFFGLLRLIAYLSKLG
jgi:nitrate reductase NapE component